MIHLKLNKMGTQLSINDNIGMPEISVSFLTGIYKKAATKDNLDPLFKEAACLVVLYQLGSASLIQRLLKTNYSRAAKIIDQMEAMNIVGQFLGDKVREVNYKTIQSLEKLFREKQIA
jgi:DNA segregation ATPase FtsK/SpoIIIE-like protein